MTQREQTIRTISEPDVNLCAVSLVRRGDAEIVRRLVACGARVVAQGDHLDALVIASEPGASDREGALVGVDGWVLLRWRRREVLVVLVEPKDEEEATR